MQIGPQGGRKRIARGIVRLDFPSREAGEHAARKGAIGCNQGSGLVFLDGLAQRNRNRERFLLGIFSFDERYRLKRVVQRKIGICQLLPPVGGCSRPQGFRDIALTRGRDTPSEGRDLISRDADPAQQRVHGELRMPQRRRVVAITIPGNDPP